MLRFVPPETCVLPLSDGETITVKRRLTHGETIACLARMYEQRLDPEGRRRVDPLRSGDALIIAYLVDWTAKDASGTKVDLRGLSPDDLQAILDNLDNDSVREIKTAIEAHEAAMSAERSAQKKTDGVSASPPTLQSVA